jgi:hypothetical protein
MIQGGRGLLFRVGLGGTKRLKVSRTGRPLPVGPVRSPMTRWSVRDVSTTTMAGRLLRKSKVGRLRCLNVLKVSLEVTMAAVKCGLGELNYGCLGLILDEVG